MLPRIASISRLACSGRRVKGLRGFAQQQRRTSSSHAVSRRSLSLRGAALVGVGAAATGTALYLSQQRESEGASGGRERELLLALRSVQRILRLLGVTSVMAADYLVSLTYYHSLARNDLQAEYERQYLLLQQLQGRQQELALKLQRCRRAGEQGLVSLYEQQMADNKAEMDRLSYSLMDIYEGDEQRDGREQFYAHLHRRNAERLRALCASNGGVYVKIGQHIAVLDHVFPPEYHAALSSLLANTPTSPLSSVRRVLETDLGAPLEQLFDSFDPVPIASASLAQVHIAYKDGVKLAVKVQHEGLRESVAVDLFVVTELVRFLKHMFPSFRYDWLTKELNSTIPPELDFKNEVRNIYEAKRTLKSFVDSGDVAIPEPVENKSSSRVLTMSFEDGVYISQIRDSAKYKLRPADISSLISRLFAEQIFQHGFVHCDPHEANLLVRSHPRNPNKPQIVLLDHGLYRTLDDDFRRDYVRLWQSMILADEQRIENYCRRLHVGDLYAVLATVLTMKPWDDIVSENASKMQTHINDKEILQLQAFGRHYHDEIITLLGAVPSDLLLLLKANDCLRHLDRLLQTPVNSTAVMGEVASRVIFEEEKQRLVTDSEKTYWQLGMELLQLWRDYGSVQSRVAALSLFGSTMQGIKSTLKKWKEYRSAVLNALLFLLE